MKDASPEMMSIFCAAVERSSPKERATFVEEACGQNVELRARVDALLRAHDLAGAFLPEQVEGVRATIAQPSPELPGTIIGQYKLMEQIGEGGFGVVFVAEQHEPVRRKVALKILKPGMDTRQVIVRFEAERQALAIMDHPNIARIFDGGATPSGRPYFVMELVKGVPITEFCDQNHLTPRQRLELFVPVCQAVQHAHQKAIIHRDLKPSNVLVSRHDTTPVVKVIDFGVAKAVGQELTDKTLFTGIAQMIGTPLYMSPEQAGMSDLDVDTRSDIYSLGVMLYELLTGTTPFSKERFKQAAYDEIRRIIREEEPPKPSTRLSELSSPLAPRVDPDSRSELTTLPSVAAQRDTEPAKLTKLVRGELDWIVMKALEKDRNRRYESANGFAIDVQRYLADEPVLAGPPGATYRLKKFLRRNRGPVLAATLVLLVLIGGIIGTTLGLLQAQASQEHAERARENEARERKGAEVARDRAADTLDAMTSYVAGDALTQQKVITPAQRRFLITALAYYRELLQEQASDDQARKRIAAANFRVGIIEYRLGRREQAAVLFRAARDLYAKLASEFPDPQLLRALATCHTNLAIQMSDLGKLQEADRELRVAIDIQKKLAIESADGDLFARSRRSLGIVLEGLGKLDEAEAEYRAALAIHIKLVAEFPAVPEYRFEKANTHNNLGILLKRLNNPERAEIEHRAALDLQKNLVAEFPDIAEYRHGQANSHNSLASVLLRLGKREQAEKELRAAIDLRQQLVAAFPSLPQERVHLGTHHNNLGKVLGDLDKREQAERELRTAISIRQKLVKDFPALPDNERHLATSHNNLGDLLRRWGKRNDSETEHRAALDIQKKLAEFPTVPDYRSHLATTHAQLGLVLHELGKLDEAEKEFRAALEIENKLVAEFPAVAEYAIGLAGTCCNFAMMLRAKRPVEALTWYDQAISSLGPIAQKEQGFGMAREFLRNSHWGRAKTLDGLKRYEEAAKDWAALLRVLPRPDPFFQRQLMNSRVRAGQFDLALKDAELFAKSEIKKDVYDCACVYAFTHAKTKEEKHALRAVELLRRAILARGFPELAQVKNEAALDSLRAREDFREVFEAANRADALWRDLLTGQTARHRFSETKHEGLLTADKAKQVHVVEMNAGTTYVLDLESKAFDTFMILENRDGSPLAKNDDIRSDNLNSRIIYIPEMCATYRIIVTAFIPGATGPYVLRIRELVTEK